MSFIFSLDDPEFQKWLFEGLYEHSSPEPDGTIVSDTRAFQADVRDGHFNGLDLSTNQVNYLVSLFKGEKIEFNSFGHVRSKTNEEHSPPSSRVNKLVDDFFSACRLNRVSPAGDFFGKTKNYLAERVLDTGTEEARLKQLLRSVRSPVEMHELKRQVSLDFRSGGKSFDEILFSELSGRERGRILGIVRAKEKGRNYYLGKAYGPMGQQNMTLAKIQKVALHVMEEVEREKDQKELHYGMGNDWRGKATEWLRQEQDWKPLEEANGKLSHAYKAIVEMISRGYTPGKGEIDKLNRAMIDVEMELDIYRSAEKEGLNQVEGSYVAAEEGSYTVVGASVALLSGTFFAPVVGATAAVLAGGVGGTLAETAIRAEGLILKNNFNGLAMTQALHTSATNGFATSVGLGMGMASGRLVSPVFRQVVVNEAMAGAHAVLRADETYGIDEVLVMGASGFVGGKVEATALGANRLTNLAFESTRETAENLAEAQFGDEGNVTTEVVIGSMAGALTELGGSKVFVGAKRRSSMFDESQPDEAEGDEGDQGRPLLFDRQLDMAEAIRSKDPNAYVVIVGDKVLYMGPSRQEAVQAYDNYVNNNAKGYPVIFDPGATTIQYRGLSPVLSRGHALVRVPKPKDDKDGGSYGEEDYEADVDEAETHDENGSLFQQAGNDPLPWSEKNPSPEGSSEDLFYRLNRIPDTGKAGDKLRRAKGSRSVSPEVAREIAHLISRIKEKDVLGILRTKIYLLPKSERKPFIEMIAERLKDDDPEIQTSALYALKFTVHLLPQREKERFLKIIEKENERRSNNLSKGGDTKPTQRGGGHGEEDNEIDVGEAEPSDLVGNTNERVTKIMDKLSLSNQPSLANVLRELDISPTNLSEEEWREIAQGVSLGFQNGDPLVRTGALGTLRWIFLRLAVQNRYFFGQKIALLLTDPDPSVSEKAFEVIGKIFNDLPLPTKPGMEERLEGLLNHPSPSIQFLAVITLANVSRGAIRNENLYPVAQKAIKHLRGKSEGMRLLALEALLVCLPLLSPEVKIPLVIQLAMRPRDPDFLTDDEDALYMVFRQLGLRERIMVASQMVLNLQSGDPKARGLAASSLKTFLPFLLEENREAIEKNRFYQKALRFNEGDSR